MAKSYMGSMGAKGRMKAKGSNLMKTTTGKGVVGSVGKLNRKTNAPQETSKCTHA